MERRRGFTLLEVMVAMAILAMGLTIILSSQAGLFATTQRVKSETHASSLMRCKMSEIELNLEQEGFSLLDRSESGDCCDDFDSDFTCEWTIETIELPQPATFADPADMAEEAEEGIADSASAASPFGSPLGDAAALNPMQGTALQGVAGMDDLAGTLGEGAQGGGMIGMALGMVYPTLKPMLEASIRKVKVAVIWNEGSKERRFEAVQYVTNPMEGGLNPNAAEGVDALMEQLNGALTGEESSAPDAAEGEGE